MISYCPICGKPVYFGERKRSLGKDYHPLCLKCCLCKRQLSPGQHAEYDDKPYCNHCYMQQFGPRECKCLAGILQDPRMSTRTTTVGYFTARSRGWEAMSLLKQKKIL